MVGNRLELLRWQTSAAIGGTAAGGFVVFVILLQTFMPIIVPPAAVVLLIAAFVLFSAYRDLWANAILIFRQRMNLIHQRAFIEEIMENSFDGLVVTNSYGEIVAHNDAACDLLRADEGSIEKRALNEFLPANKEFLFPGVSGNKAKPQGESRQPVVVRFNPHGEPEYYLEFMPGMYSRQTARRAPQERRTTDRVFYTYTFRDVTQRVKREISDRLERDRALEQNRAKSEVLASMSHELRTPLNAILGFSEIMKNEMLGPLTDAYRGYADGVHESGRHLLSLIDEMLDMARIDVGQFTMEEALFDISRTLKEVMRIAEGWPDIRNRFVTVKIADDLPQMMGSARLVKQCVINILANAIKYSSDGDSVTIKADLNSNGDLAIEVADTGIGIDDDQIEFVIKPFYRAGGVSTRGPDGGVGLGLSLVDSYVRSHGGRLEIFSKPGLGTNVRMIFPATRLFTAEKPGLISSPTDDGHDEGDEQMPTRSENVIDFRNKK
jgi:signal transduction histidine kinase